MKKPPARTYPHRGLFRGDNKSIKSHRRKVNEAVYIKGSLKNPPFGGFFSGTWLRFGKH